MAARDQCWPMWKDGLGTIGCECVRGYCAQQTRMKISAHSRKSKVMRGLCLVRDFIPRTAFWSRNEELPLASKDPQPQTLQTPGKRESHRFLSSTHCSGQQLTRKSRNGGSVRNLCWITVKCIRTAARQAVWATEAPKNLGVGPNF